MYAYKGTFNAATSTGNQTITGIVDENGNSFTPKAILVWGTGATSAAFADGWTYCWGISDGTTTLSAGTAGSDNAVSQLGRSIRSTSLVRMIDAAGTALRTGAFSSFGSGQFVINWTTVTGSAEVFHFIAFGGTDLNVSAVDTTINSAENSRSLTTVSNFKGLINIMGFGSTSQAGATGNGIGWLVMNANSPIKQAVACTHIRNNVNPSKCARYQRTDQHKACFTAASDATIFCAAGRDSIAESYSVAGSSTNVVASTLAFGGIGMAAGSGLQPTSTGTQAITGVGFSPKAVLLVSVGNTSSTSAATENRMSAGGADRTRQGHTFAGSNNSVSPSECVTYHDTSNIITCGTPNATAASSTVQSRASIQSIDSDGFTLNWGTADATQREYIWLAFGDAPAASSGEKSTTFVGMC